MPSQQKKQSISTDGLGRDSETFALFRGDLDCDWNSTMGNLSTQSIQQNRN